MTKRYMILNNGPVRWIWDSQKEQMFKEAGGLAEEVNGNLHTLEKFDPFVSIEKETDKRPVSISFDKKANRDRKLGKG